ncbi:efflux transporter outer membrane subunit [Neisseriaceae bacterium B1]
MQLKKLSGSLIICFALAACQSTKIDTQSRVNLPAQFDQAQAQGERQDIARWWQYWQDPVLNQLVEQGLQTGYDIRIAQSRLNEARATARLARTDLGPQAGVSANAAYQKMSINNPLDGNTRAMVGQFAPDSALAGNKMDGDVKMAGLGVAASWEPDIFGQKRSDADAAQAGALGAQEQFYGAQMLLASDIADAYLQARALQQRMKQTDSNINNLSEMVRYIQGRFRAGHVSAHEVDESQAALQAMQGKRATLDAEYALQVRKIAVLTGQTPQTFRLPESQVNVLANQPAAPQGETPEGLLERRPDIRGRAAAVQARAAKLASAKADYYPRFKINFLGQNGRIEVGSDTALNGWASLLSVGISVPIFSNGRIKANVAAADARLQTALLEYDQTVLRALADVDNAYHMHHDVAAQTQRLQQSADLYQKQARDSYQLFQNGYKTLDEALRARINADNAAENLTRVQLGKAQALMGLYKALGGGWQP